MPQRRYQYSRRRRRKCKSSELSRTPAYPSSSASSSCSSIKSSSSSSSLSQFSSFSVQNSSSATDCCRSSSGSWSTSSSLPSRLSSATDVDKLSILSRSCSLYEIRAGAVKNIDNNASPANNRRSKTFDETQVENGVSSNCTTCGRSTSSGSGSSSLLTLTSSSNSSSVYSSEPGGGCEDPNCKATQASKSEPRTKLSEPLIRHDWRLGPKRRHNYSACCDCCCSCRPRWRRRRPDCCVGGEAPKESLDVGRTPTRLNETKFNRSEENLQFSPSCDDQATIFNQVHGDNKRNVGGLCECQQAKLKNHSCQAEHGPAHSSQAAAASRAAQDREQRRPAASPNELIIFNKRKISLSDTTLPASCDQLEQHWLTKPTQSALLTGDLELFGSLTSFSSAAAGQFEYAKLTDELDNCNANQLRKSCKDLATCSQLDESCREADEGAEAATTTKRTRRQAARSGNLNMESPKQLPSAAIGQRATLLTLAPGKKQQSRPLLNVVDSTTALNVAAEQPAGVHNDVQSGGAIVAQSRAGKRAAGLTVATSSTTMNELELAPRLNNNMSSSLLIAGSLDVSKSGNMTRSGYDVTGDHQGRPGLAGKSCSLLLAGPGDVSQQQQQRGQKHDHHRSWQRKQQHQPVYRNQLQLFYLQEFFIPLSSSTAPAKQSGPAAINQQQQLEPQPVRLANEADDERLAADEKESIESYALLDNDLNVDKLAMERLADNILEFAQRNGCAHCHCRHQLLMLVRNEQILNRLTLRIKLDGPGQPVVSQPSKQRPLAGGLSRANFKNKSNRRQTSLARPLSLSTLKAAVNYDEPASSNSNNNNYRDNRPDQRANQQQRLLELLLVGDIDDVYENELAIEDGGACEEADELAEAADGGGGLNEDENSVGDNDVAAAAVDDEEPVDDEDEQADSINDDYDEDPLTSVSSSSGSELGSPGSCPSDYAYADDDGSEQLEVAGGDRASVVNHGRRANIRATVQTDDIAPATHSARYSLQRQRRLAVSAPSTGSQSGETHSEQLTGGEPPAEQQPESFDAGQVGEQPASNSQSLINSVLNKGKGFTLAALGGQSQQRAEALSIIQRHHYNNPNLVHRRHHRHHHRDNLAGYSSRASSLEQGSSHTVPSSVSLQSQTSTASSSEAQRPSNWKTYQHLKRQDQQDSSNNNNNSCSQHDPIDIKQQQQQQEDSRFKRRRAALESLDTQALSFASESIGGGEFLGLDKQEFLR